MVKWGSLWLGRTGLICLVLVSACSIRHSSLAEKITSQRIEIPQHCVGWEKIELKNSARYTLLQHDQRLVINIDAHNLRGRNLGCWQ